MCQQCPVKSFENPYSEGAATRDELLLDGRIFHVGDLPRRAGHVHDPGPRPQDGEEDVAHVLGGPVVGLAGDLCLHAEKMRSLHIL